jgi:hypothetical protein
LPISTVFLNAVGGALMTAGPEAALEADAVEREAVHRRGRRS